MLTGAVSAEVLTAMVYVPAGGLVTPFATTVTEVPSATAVGVVMVTVALELLRLGVADTAMPPTVYALAEDGNTVPVGPASVMVPDPAASAPEELVVKPTVYTADAPAVAGLGLGPLTLVTEVAANAVLPRKGNIPNPAISATATLARALLAECKL